MHGVREGVFHVESHITSNSHKNISWLHRCVPGHPVQNFMKAWGEKNLGFEKLFISGLSPKERPDRSNTTERTIASSKSGSTTASWNISRRRSSERDLMRHRATARPGLLAGSSCSRLIRSCKRRSNGIKYAHSQTWIRASK